MILKTKLQLALISIATVSIVITGWQSFQYARDALETITFARLTAIRETKKQEIESYFRQLRNQIITLAEDRMMIEATRTFTRSFRLLRKQESSEAIRQYFLRADSASEKGIPEQVLDYERARSTYQPGVQNVSSRFSYSNILLADADNGEIVYSLTGRGELATSLLTGALRRTNIANAFIQANGLPENGAAVLVDFAFEDTLDSPPVSFIASPVFDGAKRIGVLLFQMSIQHINDLMTSGTKWEEEGLGKTGETYIVGADYTMRNDSRFFVQDSAAYFKRLLRVGTDSSVLARIRSRSTSILTQHAHTEATQDAFRGNTDTRILDDYRGISVLSSYTPLNIPGVRWVMLAEIDAHEAFAPVVALRERLIFVGLLLLLLAAVVGFILSRTISNPLIALTSSTERFGKGDMFQRAADTSNDEIGVLARTFNRMADSLEENTQRLQTEIAERRRAEEESKMSREELRSLSAHLQTVREEERMGVAREIHDELGQALSSLKLELALMKEELFQSPREAEKRISSMSDVCDTTIKCVRRIITQLRPRLLDDLGLTAAIEWQVEEFQQRTSIDCSLKITPEEIALDAARSTAIFRILQETLTNVARHSGATIVNVQLRMDNAGVTLNINDNGKGIDERQVHSSRSFGLLGIRERAHYWSGTVTISGKPEAGTNVSVFLPGDFIARQG